METCQNAEFLVRHFIDDVIELTAFSTYLFMIDMHIPESAYAGIFRQPIQGLHNDFFQKRIIWEFFQQTVGTINGLFVLLTLQE